MDKYLVLASDGETTLYTGNSCNDATDAVEQYQQGENSIYWCVWSEENEYYLEFTGAKPRWP